MGDFCRPSVSRKAAKEHLCISCGWRIKKGELYDEQTGYWDGKAFRNKFHAECFSALSEEGAFEFTPYSGEPPERLLIAAGEVKP